MTFKQFSKSLKSVLERFDTFVSSTALGDRAIADHVSFKCENREEYEHIRSILEQEGPYMYQSWISNRHVSIVKMHTPFSTALGDIKYIELGDQKPDNSQVSGFDHIEIYPKDGNYDALVDYLEGKRVQFTLIERPHHTTHDAVIFDAFKLRLTEEPILDKIKREQMV